MKNLVDRFKNQNNGYIVRGTTPYSFVLCLLLGSLYFLFKGNIKHFALSAILAAVTSPFYFASGFIYLFAVFEINRDHYMKCGWVAV